MNVVLYLILIAVLCYRAYTNFKPFYVPIIIFFILSTISSINTNTTIGAVLLITQIVLLIIALFLAFNNKYTKIKNTTK